MEREEFAEFYAGSFARLVGQLYAMTGDQCEAQDAVQEAFVRAWARHGKLDRTQAPEAWVRVTAWRIAVSRWSGPGRSAVRASHDLIPGGQQRSIPRQGQGGLIDPHYARRASATG